MELFNELIRHLGTHFNLTALETPWQNGMVERHGGVLGDITAIVMETSPVGLDQMKDVCMHVAMAKNPTFELCSLGFKIEVTFSLQQSVSVYVFDA